MENGTEHKILILTYILATLLIAGYTLGGEIPELIGVRPIESLENEQFKLVNPKFCPTKMEWVAFQKISGNTLTMICRSDLYTEDPNYITTVAIRPGINENSTQFSWCPVTYQGQQYYSFIADNSNGAWDIYVNKVGSRDPAIKLTDNPAREKSPVWNAEGNRIAYISEDNAINLITGLDRLFTLNDADAIKTTTLLQSEDELSDLTFSPGSNFLAYTRLLNDGTSNLEVISLNESSTPQILHKTNAYVISGTSWRSDGQMLAFYAVYQDNSTQIMVIAIKQTNTGELKATSDALTIEGNFLYDGYASLSWIPWYKTIAAIQHNEDRSNDIVLINILESSGLLEERIFHLPLSTLSHSGVSVTTQLERIYLTYLNLDHNWSVHVGQLLPYSLAKLEAETISESKWLFAGKSLQFWNPKASYVASARWLESEYARTGETKYLDKATKLKNKGKSVAYSTLIGYGVGAIITIPYFLKKSQFDSRLNELGLAAGDSTNDSQLRDLFDETNELKPIAIVGGSVIAASYLTNIILSYLDAPRKIFPDMVDANLRINPYFAIANNKAEIGINGSF